ncbi:MAG: Trk family potassium uptake protein [Lachnospiraceae bacterium]|nr:Trk family potassium uptake protein [Lachnospiraceae bacterium]
MAARFGPRRLSSFQIIIIGFAGVILLGGLILTLPIASQARVWTSFGDALFTSTSAVCVTGLVVQDTATYWSAFGQGIILVMIQIGGIGVIAVAVFVASISGKKLSLMQRSTLQDSISAHQIGGVVHMTGFIIRVVFITELAGAIVLMPTFCKNYGIAGVWMSVFHSISAFCNAGFDLMGSRTGQYSSLTGMAGNPGVVIPITLLIILGGIGFLTWADVKEHKLHFKRYRMQSKVVLVTTALLIFLPMLWLFFGEYSGESLGDRLCLSLFQAVTPRTAGFNTSDLAALSGVGQMLIIFLMLIGGSPGSTAGGMKTTTIAVLFANATQVFRRRKNAQMFGRRIDDGTVKTASTILVMYLFLALFGASVISAVENIPLSRCIFETGSAVATVGLSLGLTPTLGFVSRAILMFLMFFGRVGGLTIIYAALSTKTAEVSKCPEEKITVG